MVMVFATCHPDRRHYAHGDCECCYKRKRARRLRRERLAQRRKCGFCEGPFPPTRSDRRYCSELCGELARGQERRRKRPPGERLHATRDRNRAAWILASYIEDHGLKPRRSPLGGRGSGYVVAWRRGPVFMVKARLPKAA